MGIRPILPVKGVGLLLGNDLAGDKVIADPYMSNFPCSYSDIDLAVQDIPGLYPACAVTRVMAKGIENNCHILLLLMVVMLKLTLQPAKLK